MTGQIAALARLLDCDGPIRVHRRVASSDQGGSLVNVFELRIRGSSDSASLAAGRQPSGPGRSRRQATRSSVRKKDGRSSGSRTRRPERMPSRWRNEDDALLARLYGAGVTRREVATRLGRSEDAVDARRRALGIPARRRTRPWSSAEDALVRAATTASVPASELAARIGRPSEAVRRRRRELRLAAMAASRRYSALEDDALCRAWLDGGDLDALAAELGRSPESVRLRARALGLHNPKRRLRWLPGEDLLLRQAYGRGLTCTAISTDVLRGRSAGAIAARARKLGLAVYGRIWSADEDRRLVDLAAERTPLEEAAALHFRTPEAVRRRARKLGLKPFPVAAHEHAHRRWRPDEDALLRRHASLDPGARAPARTLRPRGSPSACRSRPAPRSRALPPLRAWRLCGPEPRRAAAPDP